MANMAIELGAKFAFLEADAVTGAHDAALGIDVDPFGPDPDAAYEQTFDVDVGSLDPPVALPRNPGNVRAVAEVAEEAPVRVDQAFLGSCTNARLEDLEIAARMLKGRKVADSTRLIVTPASHQVFLDATIAGHVEVLLEAGAHLTTPGCGTCPGGHDGVVGPDENCVSSTNRNFPGRMGSPEGRVYLASPATVAASAITGVLTDPRELWAEAAS